MATSQLLPVGVGSRSEVRRPTRPAPSGASAHAPLRLTRRGRWVVRAVLVGLFALGVTVAVLLIARPAEAGTQVRPVPVTYHMVLPGETLLEIAATVDPTSDARDVAVRIARLNALEGWGLQAGQRLALPVDA